MSLSTRECMASIFHTEGQNAINTTRIVFIHFYSASHSMSSSETLPTTTLCRSFHAEALQATVVLDLPKVPTWQLELDSKPRPSGRKASSLPMRRHAPRYLDVISHPIGKTRFSEYFTILCKCHYH